MFKIYLDLLNSWFFNEINIHLPIFQVPMQKVEFEDLIKSLYFMHSFKWREKNIITPSLMCHVQIKIYYIFTWNMKKKYRCSNI